MTLFQLLLVLVVISLTTATDKQEYNNNSNEQIGAGKEDILNLIHQLTNDVDTDYSVTNINIDTNNDNNNANIYSNDDGMVPSLDWQRDSKSSTNTLRRYRHRVLGDQQQQQEQVEQQQQQDQRQMAIFSNNLKKESEQFLANLFTAQQLSLSTNISDSENIDPVPNATNTTGGGGGLNNNTFDGNSDNTTVSDDGLDDEDPDDVEKNAEDDANGGNWTGYFNQSNDVKCTTADGYFGAVNGTPFIITFLYGVETPANITPDILSYQLLPPLETAFNNLLLTLLFPLKCQPSLGSVSSTARTSFKDLDPNNNRALEQLVQRTTSTNMHRRDEDQYVGGISAKPSDKISDDLTCKPSDPTLDRICYVVQGQLTLYIDGTRGRQMKESNNHVRTLQSNSSSSISVSDYQDKIRTVLKDGMNSGVFNDGEKYNPDTRIKRVYYIDRTGDDSSINNDKGTQPQAIPKSNNNNNTIIASVVAGAGALLVVVGVLAYRRRAGGVGNGSMDDDANGYDGDSTTLQPQ